MTERNNGTVDEQNIGVRVMPTTFTLIEVSEYLASPPAENFRPLFVM